VLLSSLAHAKAINSHEIKQIDAKSIIVSLNGEDLHKDNISIFEIPGDSPRIVVDLKNTGSILLKNGNYAQQGLSNLQGIRAAKRNQNSIRFVIDMQPGSRLKSKSITSTEIKLSIAGQFTPKVIVQPAVHRTVMATASTAPVPRIKPEAPKKPVIVIDAGHGGRDPGAIGGTGLQEKSVTLKAANELKSQLQATGRYKVVLSRSKDTYVEHENRLKTARTNGADLFISIHADATAGKTARGASVYTLADRAKNRSRRIVNSQNWIMDVNLSQENEDVGNILVDLAQRSTISGSTRFADILIGRLGKSTPLIRNTHRRAGYYVLLAPDVPAVLLELGFISNKHDEQLLKSDTHRRKVMSSVVSAINTYFATQKP